MIAEKIAKELITLQTDYFKSYIENSIQCEKDIAMLRVQTKEIQSQKEIVKIYFEHRLEERKRLFELANKVLDKAILDGNREIAQVAIETIRLVNDQLTHFVNRGDYDGK